MPVPTADCPFDQVRSIRRAAGPSTDFFVSTKGSLSARWAPNSRLFLGPWGVTLRARRETERGCGAPGSGRAISPDDRAMLGLLLPTGGRIRTSARDSKSLGTPCPNRSAARSATAAPSSRRACRRFLEPWGFNGLCRPICAQDYDNFFQAAVDIIDTIRGEFVPPARARPDRPWRRTDAPGAGQPRSFLRHQRQKTANRPKKLGQRDCAHLRACDCTAPDGVQDGVGLAAKEAAC